MDITVWKLSVVIANNIFHLVGYSTKGVVFKYFKVCMQYSTSMHNYSTFSERNSKISKVPLFVVFLTLRRIKIWQCSATTYTTKKLKEIYFNDPRTHKKV